MQTLIGDKLGPRPYPCRIRSDEFQILYEQGRQEGKDVLLVDEWFVRDDNVLPAVYVLQPVTSRFPFFNDESEGNKNRKKKVKSSLILRMCAKLSSVFTKGHQLQLGHMTEWGR